VEDFLALCSRQPGNELIAAECEHLTGGSPGPDGLATCRTLESVSRAAYIRAGMRRIAGAETLEALCTAIAKAAFDAEDFRIEFLRLSEHLAVRESEAVLAAANAIPAHPNLDSPRHRFLLTASEQGFSFGEVLAEPNRSYRRHESRPYHTTSSLPSRIARALVNLVVPPARTIFDPCCGTGSILLEAQALGLEAFGADRNPRMVGMARKNLAFFGYPAEVTQADARACDRTAGAIVTDLPYGLSMVLEQENIAKILERASHLAPAAVFVAGSDLSGCLRSAGYTRIAVYRVWKQHKVLRFVHMCER
jgi:tRNA G10  N-methylase Trm11